MQTSTQKNLPSLGLSFVTHTSRSQFNLQQISIIRTQIAHLRLFVLGQVRIGGIAVAIAVLHENTHKIDDATYGAEGDEGDADAVAGLVSGRVFS